VTAIAVKYHHEEGSWWAESDDVPGFSAVGASLAEVREQVREGLPFHLDVGSVDLRESLADSEGVVTSMTMRVTVCPENSTDWPATASTAGITADYRITSAGEASTPPTIRHRLIA